MKIVMIMAFIATTLNAMGQPVVTSPTPGQVYYPGETMQIRWNSLPQDPWTSVYIMLQNVRSDTVSWVVFDTPNDGEFDWIVSKGNTSNTNFAIKISGNGGTIIPIIIQNGVRPQPVEVSLFQGVVIEWESIPGNTYRIEKSTNSIDWETIAEERVDFTPAYIVDYTEGRKISHRVLDITNGAQPVEIQVSRSVSLEWTSIPGHTYRVVTSIDLVNWETAAEGTVDFDYAYFDDYAEDSKAFFRVLDLTP